MKVRKIAINGYYGMGNAGDEAVLACVLEQIAEAGPEIKVTVLSGSPGATSATYGVNASSRMGIAALKAIAGSDLYVSGGGSLLQDATSSTSILYYLALMGFARLASRKYAIYANGIGPISRGWAKGMVRMAVDGASSVSVRDAGSARFLEEIGSQRKDVLLSADPVFAIKPASEGQVIQAVGKSFGKQAAEYISDNAGRLAIIAIRNWKGLENGAEALCGMGSLLEQRGFAPLGLAFQPELDKEPTMGTLKRCRKESPVISCGFHPAVTAGIFAMAGITVGMRLHSLIMSAGAGVPAFGISYDPKVDALYEMLPLGKCVSVGSLASEGEAGLLKMLDGLGTYRQRLAATLPAVRQRASEAAGFMLRKAEAR